MREKEGEKSRVMVERMVVWYQGTKEGGVLGGRFHHLQVFSLPGGRNAARNWGGLHSLTVDAAFDGEKCTGGKKMPHVRGI